ncbi:putative ABC transport system permease protein [Sporosarcina luteola]|nr:putative ABC transport system permease protein [Sporosarcina luteola]
MTIYDVVLKNLKYNIGRYAIYIASLVFSVLIYFTFVSLQYNEQISEAFGRNDKMAPLLTGGSVLIALFILVFIWYSNTFFISNRKQEIGLYSLVGGTKEDIGWMLFYENMSLSLLALGVGIGLGQLLSIFFSMILLKVMGFALIAKFSVNVTAVLQTVFVFGLIMLATSVHGFFIMNRVKLVDLFQAKHKVQTIWRPSISITSIAIVLIGFVYWTLLHAFDSVSWSDHFGRNFSLTLVTLIIATYLLFHSGSGLMVHLLQKRKRSYYRWKNLLTFTQLKSRLRSNGFLLTIISVLNGVTLVAFGFGYTLYFNTLRTLDDHVPYSYQFDVQSSDVENQITNILEGNKEHPVLFDETFEYLVVPGDAYGLDPIPTGYHYYDESFAVLPISTYNLLADRLGRSPLKSIGAEETIIIGRNFIGSQKEDLNAGSTLTLRNNQEDLLFQVIGNKIEYIFSYQIQPPVLIVADEVFKRLGTEANMVSTRVVKVKGEQNSAHLTESLKAVYMKGKNYPDFADLHEGFYSYSESYQLGQSIYGILVFVFGFIGLVFLAATGSIIYFKVLTEAAEDRRRYEILRNIGLSRRKVKQVIAKQTSFLFLLPLIVGIAHSSVILSALSKVMDLDFLSPVSISVIVYACLYGIYYKMTIATANKLVNS